MYILGWFFNWTELCERLGVNHAYKLQVKFWGLPPKNSRPQNCQFLVVFRRFRDLMANIFVRKRDMQTTEKLCWKLLRVPYTFSIFHELLYTNR